MKLVRQLPLVMALGLCATHAFADTTAGDGTVTFKGKVIAQTCQVTTKDVTVNMPTVQMQSLGAAGDTAGQERFQIQLTGCAHGDHDEKHVAAAFSNPQADANTGNLVNIDSSNSAAQKVEVQLLNADGSAITVNDPKSSKGVVIGDDGTATIPYLAQYYATGAASQGPLTANTTFTLSYE
ncbi:fimbrial protein [Burkholderia latens]|uniref:fimbrial protein n=1 Tax=Burkholderia latens TaxID=488446 RepID=UPI00158CADE6|nr:fimbrial protein [Burkholderia latens]